MKNKDQNSDNAKKEVKTVVVMRLDSTEVCSPFEASPVKAKPDEEYIGQIGKAVAQSGSAKGYYDVTFADGAIGAFKEIELEFLPRVEKRNIVTFELAEKLFLGGFNEPCIQYYGRASKVLMGSNWSESDTKKSRNSEYDSTEAPHGVISAPTVEQANEWLVAKNNELEATIRKHDRERDVEMAWLHKSDIKGMYGLVTKGDDFDFKKMEELLFNLAQQGTSVGIDRLKEIAGEFIAPLAMKMFPGVDVNDKFADFKML